MLKAQELYLGTKYPSRTHWSRREMQSSRAHAYSDIKKNDKISLLYNDSKRR